VFSLDLAPAEFRPVRYDARGHGESGDPQEPDAYRWDELARNQIALAGSLRIDTFVTT